MWRRPSVVLTTILAETPEESQEVAFPRCRTGSRATVQDIHPWPGVPRPHNPRLRRTCPCPCPRVHAPELPRAGADRHAVMDIIMTGPLSPIGGPAWAPTAHLASSAGASPLPSTGRPNHIRGDITYHPCHVSRGACIPECRHTTYYVPVRSVILPAMSS